jgi:two-component system, OmpR family, alkaline phosphatase synthesis response regulator PhoP
MPMRAHPLILVVDDVEENLEIVRVRLEAQGYEIETAQNGREALERAGQLLPDLILLDIMMPHMSGFQVCQRLKSDPKTRDIQILMVTALNELGDIERATECGTDDFVSKPVNKFELLTRVKSLLRVRHLKSELERALTYLNEIEEDVTFYTCPMHPDHVQDVPGNCPKCGLKLVPRDRGD